MAKEITNEDGTVETLYTKEELEQQAAELETKHKAELEDKDKHVAEKLEEFKKGQTSAEQKEAQRQAEIDAANKKAEEALGLVGAEKQRRMDTVQEFALGQIVGDSPELRAKVLEYLPMVNIEIKEDKDIIEKIRLASVMAGLNNVVVDTPTFPIGGGFVPARREEAVSEDDHERFKRETGLI